MSQRASAGQPQMVLMTPHLKTLTGTLQFNTTQFSAFCCRNTYFRQPSVRFIERLVKLIIGNMSAGLRNKGKKKHSWRHPLCCHHIPEDCGESGIFSTVYRRGKWHFRAGRIPNFSPVVEKTRTSIGGQLYGLET